MKEAERYNSTSLHEWSIRGIPTLLLTQMFAWFVDIALFGFHGCCRTWENRINSKTLEVSLFLLIFRLFFLLNQCFLDCNMCLVNLQKSDEVSSETLHPCFYCFTVRVYLKACGPQYSLMSFFLLSFLYWSGLLSSFTILLAV